ncbi:MAG: ABC transporter substrate-binding protein [Saprospiraceae bacterium]|nr:ABC transporter substrate-binding protein [Saprospiraceae bacterium]
MKRTILLFVIALGLILIACNPARRSTTGPVRPNQPGKPIPGKPAPMDTIRWTPNNTGKPPIGGVPGKPAPPSRDETYHIAFLLPFLSGQMTRGVVPEKSRLAVQFYAGAKIAFEQLSSELKISLVADVWDTQGNDADFQKLMTNSRLEKASVFIGPVRSSHLEAFAGWTKARRKILISPESPSVDLTTQNPDFLQINPSLRAHCEAITRHIRKANRPDAVTLVCKQKEADRLPYFQDANNAMGGSTRFGELIVSDQTTNFDRVDLRKYLRAGRTTVFVLPSWASQDFVMVFLRKLKEIKGSNRVEVYGMPQWRNFDAIDTEYFNSLNVHVSSASWLDYSAQEVKDFQEKFYTATGTIPDEDAFNGYDVTLFTGRMLARYGLSFPEQLDDSRATTLRGQFSFSKIFSRGAVDDGRNAPDYWENTFVHILKFEKFGFVPVD